MCRVARFFRQVLSILLVVIMTSFFFPEPAFSYRLDTHTWILGQIPLILENDGYEKYANDFDKYLLEACEGAVAPDNLGWMLTNQIVSPSHGHNPKEHKGWYDFKPGGEMARRFFNQAVNKWWQGNKNEAMIDLGIALHFLEDATVLHHAHTDPLTPPWPALYLPWT